MIFRNRMEFIDQCIAGEKTQFKLFLSPNVFSTIERGYELYRDYIKQKNTITSITCNVIDEDLVFHIISTKKQKDLIPDNFPKKGITIVTTDDGLDLHIKITKEVSS